MSRHRAAACHPEPGPGILVSKRSGASYRICRATFTYPTSRYPGAGLPSYYLNQYLHAQTLHVTRRLPGDRLPVSSHVRLRSFLFPNPVLSGVTGFPVRQWRSLLKILGAVLFTVQAAPFMILFRPHITHVHTPLPLPLAAVARLLRAKVVITIHGTDILAVQRSRLLQMAIRHLADKIFYVSTAMREPLLRVFSENRLCYTPSGVDLSLFHNQGLARKRQIISVGNLRWQKGYPILLRAFQQISAKLPAYSLIIVGEGQERGRLEGLTSELGIGSKVVFAGLKSQKEIADLLNESALFVLSSVSEGFPKVLLEALACGLPVVVTDVGNCGALVRGSQVGFVVPPNEPSSLAAAVVGMLTDRQRYEDCVERSERTAQKYNWEAIAQLVSREYERLLGRS